MRLVEILKKLGTRLVSQQKLRDKKLMREVVRAYFMNGPHQNHNAKIIAEKIRDTKGTQVVNFGNFSRDKTS